MPLKHLFSAAEVPDADEGSRMPFATRLRIALAVGFVCAGIMIVANENAHVLTSRVLTSAHQAHDLPATVGGAMLELAQAESAQRGYVLSGDTAYLTAYETARQQAKALLSQIDNAPALEDKTVQQQARAFSQAVAQKFGEMDLTVRLRQQERIDAANFILTTHVGLEQMEHARELAAALTRTAQARVESERVDANRLLNITRFGLAAGILAALLAFVLYARQTRLLQRREEQSKRALEAERDALESQVRERTARLTELATYLQQAVEEERAHLARELHDELGALLTAAKLDVARIKPRLPAEVPELGERLKHLTEILNQGIALKRRIIEDLRPSSLSNLGLVASLDILTREFGERSRIDLETALEPVDLDEARELTIYRMVQESLTNIGKYAQARHVSVTLKNYVYHAEVSVSDDGIGFDPRALPRATHGLVGMRHRIEACGGRLDISSTPGKGTRITATIPRQQPKAQSALADAMEVMALSSHSYEHTASEPTTPAAPG